MSWPLLVSENKNIDPTCCKWICIDYARVPNVKFATGDIEQV